MEAVGRRRMMNNFGRRKLFCLAKASKRMPLFQLTAKCNVGLSTNLTMFNLQDSVRYGTL